MEAWTTYHIQASQSTIVPTTIPLTTNNKDIPLIPGEKVRSYDSDDVTGTLPPNYEVILNSAARVIGVEPEDVARVVEGFENRIHDMRRGRLRKSASGILSRSHSRARKSVG
jgi:RNA polymerase I-specific transcription initiation factor RRN7